MVSQCLLSGAGPWVSTTCYTSVTVYLPCRNILHDIFCTFVEFFKRKRMSDYGFTDLTQNFLFWTTLVDHSLKKTYCRCQKVRIDESTTSNSEKLRHNWSIENMRWYVASKIGHTDNEKRKTIAFVKKLIDENSIITNVNIKVKKGCVSTLMFTLQLEFSMIDQMERPTKFRRSSPTPAWNRCSSIFGNRWHPKDSRSHNAVFGWATAK